MHFQTDSRRLAAEGQSPLQGPTDVNETRLSQF